MNGITPIRLYQPGPMQAKTRFQGDKKSEDTFFKRIEDSYEPVSTDGQVIAKHAQYYNGFNPDFYLKISIDPKLASQYGLRKPIDWFSVDESIFNKVPQDGSVPMVITFKQTWLLKRKKAKLSVDSYQISKKWNG